jgi:hypothetical protein
LGEEIMRTCFLHVGTHKTGTTALQIVLTDHHEELQQRGYSYPITGRLRPAPGHHNIAKELFNAPSFSRENGTVDELISEIRSSTHDVILSSELFQTVAFRPARANEFISELHSSGLTVVVIVYLRNQIDYIRSFYLELLKHGLRQPFDEFVQALLKDDVWSWGELSVTLYYSKLLEALERLSDVQLVVRSYDQVKDAALIPDFFSILGLDACEMGIDSNLRVNASASIFDSVVAFYQNRTGNLMDSAQRKIVESLLGELKERNIDPSPRLRQTIIGQVDVSNQGVFSKYSVPPFPRAREQWRQNDRAGTVEDTMYMEDIFATSLDDLLDDRKYLSGK